MLLSDGVPLEQGHKRGVPPKSSHFTTVGSSSIKRLQIDTHMLFIITSTDDEVFRAININDLERT